MSTELEKLLADEDKTSAQALEAAKAEEQKKLDDELSQKKVQLANVKKAIEEANTELRTKRQSKTAAPKSEEEEVPEIDFNDPGAKAWGKHISTEVNPLKEELAKEKEEIRTFAINEFLFDKPNLAKDPEKIKKVIATYEKIRTASERTKEGVINDLKRAYAAEFSDEILQGNESYRIERAQGDAIFADIAVSRGSSSYRDEKEKVPHLNQSDQAILAKWGLTPDEWQKMKKAQDKK